MGIVIAIKIQKKNPPNSSPFYQSPQRCYLVSSRRSPPVPDGDRRLVDVEAQLAGRIGPRIQPRIERRERVLLEHVQAHVDRFQHRARAVRELEGDRRGRSGRKREEPDCEPT